MIKTLKIDGFRSLLRFELQAQPGLNVLVGANGTGKSNFVTFLDFLSAFMSRDLNAAIAVAHGAGSVFSKETSTENEARLRFIIEGIWSRQPDDDRYFMTEDHSPGGAYKYMAALTYLGEVPTVYIERESLEVSSVTHGTTVITRQTHLIDRNFHSEFSIEIPANTPGLFEWTRSSKDDSFSPETYLASRVSADRSMLQHLSGENPGMAHTFRDLVSYNSVNIDPSVARRSTPVGSTIELEPTGEGLAGALYQLKRNSYLPRRHVRMFRSIPQTEGVFRSILSWCREVNPSIEQIDVRLEFADAQFWPLMHFNFGNRREMFPFARVSDGTVKWLTLVTMLLAEPSLNIIEEPENFLHPYMQEAFISLCREVIARQPNRTLLISTHSPTLLDCCAPGELTLFELENGQTRATGVANREELAEKIARSRFGLGYYYRTGALYGEDRSAS